MHVQGNKNIARFIQKMKKLFIAVLFVLISSAAFAESILEAEATVDRTTAKLGDEIRYSLIIKKHGANQQSPALQPPDFAGFRVMGTSSSSSINIINGDASIVYQQDYALMPIKQGSIVIKPAKVQVMNPATKQMEVIETKPITIHVTSGKKIFANQQPQETPTPVVTQQAYNDIKEIKMNLEFRLGDYLLYIILAIIFAAALVTVYLLIFRKKEEKPVIVEDIDFRKDALKRLRKAKALSASSDIKPYYYEIYETVREFLSRNFKESFTELTTLEIVTKLDAKKISEAKLKMLTDFLKDCDIVKFADYTPPDKEVEKNYAEAEKIINEL